MTVQSLLPNATMIGGSAVTVHTGHRLSGDADLVLRNLDRDWQEVRSELEDLQDWITDHPKIPTNLMGRYGGARVSVRKLNRLRDIELAEVTYQGRPLRVAAPAELVRMKALAILARNLTRDYVDIVALDEGLREAGSSAATAIAAFDNYYSEHKSAGSLARQVITALADPNPRETDPQAVLDELAGLRNDLKNWEQIRLRCQRIAEDIE
ncbi:hypothetical protein NRB56_04120 [Nocardia sp. RB56]|uniref:Nucleotidyl transferase AbiEii/AbiGii toxin family protein n=1 Tax=Nocardia aurantia TaxID=2585199 RepID=A0A7K0DGQ9_9NOCA|nr:hypothetical protein [Nocardia aurantia]